MLKGFTLQLYVGPFVPIPAPQVLMDALTELTVTSNDTGQSGFQLSFTLSNDSPLHTLFLLTGGGLAKIVRVVIAVIFNGTPQVLIDGVVELENRDAGECGVARNRASATARMLQVPTCIYAL